MLPDPLPVLSRVFGFAGFRGVQEDVVARVLAGERTLGVMPTGAGKSATLNYLAMMTMAIHRPRMVIVDAGESFDLLVADMAAKGLSVHRVTLSPDCKESLPPFVHAFKLLEDQDIMGSYHAAEERARASAGVQIDEAADGTPLMASVENALSTPALAPAHPAAAASAAAAEPEEDEEDEGARQEAGGEVGGGARHGGSGGCGAFGEGRGGWIGSRLWRGVCGGG